MTDYQVTWTIDIEANNPVEAAIEALKIQRDINSTASVFIVASNEDDADPWEIDLSVEEDLRLIRKNSEN